MRGEHLGHPMQIRSPGGSSPHARGALAWTDIDGSPHRIIPACAGSTGTMWCHWNWIRDHPRMRGEHGFVTKSMTPFVGSSPHARGAQKVKDIQRPPTRIIPACAGSTPSSGSSRGFCADHPRMRGEHDETPLEAVSAAGSSPHARGAPAGRQLVGSVCRIIPACAGSTSA